MTITMKMRMKKKMRMMRIINIILNKINKIHRMILALGRSLGRVGYRFKAYKILRNLSACKSKILTI